MFPIIYCFLTYYPFVSFFLEILLEIVNQIKTARIAGSRFSGAIDNKLGLTDFKVVLGLLQADRDFFLSL